MCANCNRPLPSPAMLPACLPSSSPPGHAPGRRRCSINCSPPGPTPPAWRQALKNVPKANTVSNTKPSAISAAPATLPPWLAALSHPARAASTSFRTLSHHSSTSGVASCTYWRPSTASISSTCPRKRAGATMPTVCQRDVRSRCWRNGIGGANRELWRVAM
ncbi:MAG: hypothetical protein JNIBNLAF_01273 [Nitrosomonas europaea]|nr:hypothetical protein [Nitrosomonas europaea]